VLFLFYFLLYNEETRHREIAVAQIFVSLSNSYVKSLPGCEDIRALVGTAEPS
jgi:hypothetical protein